MARLNHPNLIAVYDFGDIDGMLFIIMELVSGKSLFHSAHGVAIEQKEAARIVAGICRGLAHAHQAHILHRDIKPANILLTLEAQPKIGDFGLARPVGHTQGKDEIIFGTPGYSAPEVLNHPEAVGERTDLYAVGIILFELLTGKLPGETWTPPSTFGSVDPAFDAIVRRATHPSPELRYADANELGDELEVLAKKLEGTVLRRTTVAPAAARPTTPLARPMATSGHHRSLASKKSSAGPVVAVVAILVIGLVALGIAMNSGGNDPAPVTNSPPPPAPKPKPVVKPTPDIPDNRRLVNTPRERENRPERFKPPRKNRPEPEPEPDPEPVATIDPPMPEPDPEPVKPSYPEFDTVDFIDTGRTALQRKATSLFVKAEEEHEKNIDRYERDAKRVVRRLDNRFRDAAEAFVDGYFDSLRETNRISSPPPEKGPDALKDSRAKLREAYDEALDTQHEIDANLNQAIYPLQDAYVSGLRKKAEELQKIGNTPAEQILFEEAEKTASSLPPLRRHPQGRRPRSPRQRSRR